MGFPVGSDSKESACNVGDLGSIPGSVRSPGERMATHPSIIACRISWTEEPGRLQSMESQRVGHDRATKTFTREYLALSSYGLCSQANGLYGKVM